MDKTITRKEDYIRACDVREYPVEYHNKIERDFFGNKVILGNTHWQWHLHLKLTNVCNARCGFCVEQNSTCKTIPDHFLENVDKMLYELKKNKTFYSVSITGGEPLLFPKFRELCELLKKHQVPFITMNTNGQYLPKYVDCIDGLIHFINISRHYIDDEENFAVFKTRTVPTREELKKTKSLFKKSKVRIQCVMEKKFTVEKFVDFVNAFSFADDVSFRRLMVLGKEYGVDYDVLKEDYFQILDWVYHNAEFKEQTLQDYYIYETWGLPTKDGKTTDVTFSYSDMKMLREVEQEESSEYIREFIIHPTGRVCGSWNPNDKLLLK